MKVLIGIGTCDKFRYCEEPVLKAVFDQDYPDFDVLILDNSSSILYYTILKTKYPQADVVHISRPKYFRDALGESRNSVKNYAIANGYDYIFFVDADMVLRKDSLSKLMRHKKDFITGLTCYHHDPNNKTTIFKADYSRPSKVPGQVQLSAYTHTEIESLHTPIEIEACGLSCCLIKTPILIGMDFFISHKEMAFLEDRLLCRDLKMKGVKLFFDKTVFPKHLNIRIPDRTLRLNA